jgi:hypothetical protein
MVRFAVTESLACITRLQCWPNTDAHSKLSSSIFTKEQVVGLIKSSVAEKYIWVNRTEIQPFRRGWMQAHKKDRL